MTQKKARTVPDAMKFLMIKSGSNVTRVTESEIGQTY